MKSLSSLARVSTVAILQLFASAAQAGPAADLLPAEALTRGASASSPLDNRVFLPGKDALAARPFAGVLTINQSAMAALPKLTAAMQAGRDAHLFPGVTLEFFSDGEVLVPVQRGVMVPETATVSTASYWRVIPQFGKVWREPKDGDWSRAAVPMTVVNDTENHAHQGVATFVYRGKEISSIRFQFVQQTAPYLLKQHFVLWGGATAKLTAADERQLEARRAAARKELAGRLPARPWSDLAKQFPPGTLDGFGGPLYPKWQVLNSLVYQGTLYYQNSVTPYGDYPYPLEMRFGVRSVMKSVAAPLALLRLAEVYGPYVLNLRVGDYIKGLDPKFDRIRFIDMANMASGFGGTGTFKTNPNDTGDGYLDADYDGWYTAASNADKIAHINKNLRPYPWEPGTVMRYRDHDYYLLGVAIDAFLKSVRGPEADLWNMLGQEVFAPIGIQQAPAVRTRESGGRDGVVWANAGYYPSIDDLAKIALLYQRHGENDGRQLLHRQLTTDLLAAKNAIVQTGDASLGSVAPSNADESQRLYLMGMRFIRYVGSRSRKMFEIPAMHGSGDNRVTLYPNGIITVQMAKAAELPPGEKASGDDRDATSRVVDRMVPF